MSTPFCSVSRPTMPTSGTSGRGGQPQLLLAGSSLQAGLPRLDRLGANSSPAGGHRWPGSTPSSSMPLRIPESTLAPVLQHALQPAAEGRGLDLLGVARADGVDRVGEDQARLQQVELGRRTPSACQLKYFQSRPVSSMSQCQNLPWKAMLWMVNRLAISLVARQAAVFDLEIGRQQARLPVVGVQHVDLQIQAAGWPPSRRGRRRRTARSCPCSLRRPGRRALRGRNTGLARPGRPARCYRADGFAANVRRPSCCRSGR